MSTTPHLADDEAPLDAETIDLLLSNMGPDMVLVGGQALAFWMSRYGIEQGMSAISNDGDALGDAVRARDLAQTMRARLVVPSASTMTSIVAQLRLPAPRGKERNVDVLHLLYTVGGPKKSAIFTRCVIKNSVAFEWKDGVTLRVMDPLDLLESRAHNAVGLVEIKGPHVVTQAAWAVEVARAALVRSAQAQGAWGQKESPETRGLAAPEGAFDPRIGQALQRAFRLALSQVGRRLLSEHGIELLDAVDVDTLRAHLPEHAAQLEAVEKALTERNLGSARPSSTLRLRH